MQFTISTRRLLKHLSAINGVVVSNPVVPILANFLFEIDHGKLAITASDLQMSMTTELSIDIVDSARVAVPARILMDTLKGFPEQPLTFSIDPNTYAITICSANGVYKLAGENAADFPKLAALPKDTNQITLSSAVLHRAVRQTVFAASQDDIHPALGGVYVILGKEDARFVATDGHRLVRYIHKSVVSDVPQAFVVPRKPLGLFSQLLSDIEGDVQLKLTGHNLYFQVNDTLLVTRTIEQEYPDYENVIPVDNPFHLDVNRTDLLNALKRMAIYANRTTHQVKMVLQEGKMKLIAEDLEFSNEASETLHCSYKGRDITIGFNAKLLIELLNNLASEEVEMRFEAPQKAVLILPKTQEKQEDVLLLIMPVVLKSASEHPKA